MEIRQLQYFLAVAKRGSYTLAAKDLFVSRQALSKALRNMEKEAGCPLLKTGDGHIVLTDEGRDFYEDAEQVIAAYDKLMEHMHAHTKACETRQTLSVAMGHGASFVLPERFIETFRKAHRNVTLSVEAATTDNALDLVRNGDADIAIIGSTPPYLDGFDYRMLQKTGLIVYIPKSNKLAQKETLRIEDLHGQPFITFGRHNHLHRYFMQVCREHNVEPHILLTTSDTDMLIRTANEHNALYFCFPETLVAPRNPNRVLRQVNVEHESEFGTFAITKKGVPPTTTTKRFWEWTARCAAKMQA